MELSLPCFILVFLFYFKRKYQRIFIVILCFSCHFWWLSNLLEYRLLGYSRITNIYSLMMLFKSKNFIFSSAAIGLNLLDIVFLVVSLLGFSIFFFLFLKKAPLVKKGKYIFLSAFIALFLISFSFLGYDSYRKNYQGNILEVFNSRFNDRYWTITLVTTQAPFPEIYKIAQQIQGKNNVSNCENDVLKYNVAKYNQVDKNKIGIIGIQLESINENIIKAKFTNNQPVMPFLNNLVSASRQLTNSFYMLSERNTAASEFSSLCGLDAPSEEPFENISRFHGVCLPNILNEQGWQTYTAHANSLDFYNRGEAYSRLGFQHLFSLKEFSKLNLPLNSIGFLDWPVFHEVVKSIPWSNSNSFLHFVTLQSHVPFDPANGIRFHLNTETYLSGDIDRNTLDRYANVSNEVDGFMEKAVNQLSDISKKLDVTFVVYFYGDHAPPLRSDSFHDAKLLNMDIKQLLVKDGTIPFGVLTIKKGVLHILKYSSGQNINTIADIQKLLNLAIQSETTCKNCTETISQENVAYLSSILKTASVNRSLLDGAKQRIFLESVVSFDASSNGLMISPSPNDKVQANYQESGDLFQCKVKGVL